MMYRKALLRCVFLRSDHVGIKNQSFALNHCHSQSSSSHHSFQTIIQNIKFTLRIFEEINDEVILVSEVTVTVVNPSMLFRVGHSPSPKGGIL
jgi:hypothetical protein